MSSTRMSGSNGEELLSTSCFFSQHCTHICMYVFTFCGMPSLSCPHLFIPPSSSVFELLLSCRLSPSLFTSLSLTLSLVLSLFLSFFLYLSLPFFFLYIFLYISLSVSLSIDISFYFSPLSPSFVFYLLPASLTEIRSFSLVNTT